MLHDVPDNGIDHDGIDHDGIDHDGIDHVPSVSSAAPDPEGLPVDVPVIVTTTDATGTFVRVNPICSLPRWTPWPESTDVLCWNCCHGFATRPVPLPIQYDERRDTFHVMGNFCSWGCAKAYSRDYSRSIAGRGAHAMAIALLRKRLTGIIEPLVAAPPRVVLKAFGGYMCIEEYRRLTDAAESAWTLAPPRLITHAQVVHDRKRSEHQRRSRAKTVDLTSQIDFGPSTSTSSAPPVESLKLKRPKPVKKSSNMLEIALGLVQ